MPRPADILLVEDNEADVDLLEAALEDIDANVTLHHVADGQAALDFLHRRDPYQDAPRPSLVLLDLNLPLCNGRDVLREVKTDPVLRVIPVIVMSSSKAPSDVTSCYQLGANSFVTKPVEFEGFTRVIHSLESFWLGTNLFPPAQPA